MSEEALPVENKDKLEAERRYEKALEQWLGIPVPIEKPFLWIWSLFRAKK